MKTIVFSISIILCIGLSLSLYAQDAQGPLGMTPFGTPTGEDERGGTVVSAEEAELAGAQQTWFEQQMTTISLAQGKDLIHQKSVAQIYKRLKDQEKWNKNYTLQRFLEIANKVEEIGNTVAAYGEHIILQENGSYLRYYDGKLTDIFNLEEKDNYGNTNIVNIMNMKYLSTDEFEVNYDTTLTHLLEYIKLTYNPFDPGAIKYLKFDDAEYISNIDDRPSAYTTTEGTVEKTSALSLFTPDDTDAARRLYQKLVNEIAPAIEAALSYAVTTAFSNINYYTLDQDTATNTTAGGVYGEKSNYDFTQTSTDALDASETGSVSNIQYYLFDKPFVEALDQLWWHAQDATLKNLHRDEDVREASSHTVVTKLGITREIDFYDAVYDTTDNHNVLSSYKETQKINGTEVGRFHYYDIVRDSRGRQTGYKLSADIYGLPYSREYWEINYDVLSRITSYRMRETIDGVTITYRYWDISYNNLWQQTSYYYTLDGVEHFRSAITYNSYGLVSSYMDTYLDNGVEVTTYRFNTYNANGLLSEYTEHILRQSDTVNEFYFVYVGNITYNSIYAIISYDQITIKDTNATTITDYSDKIPLLLASFTFDGTTWSISSSWSDWGFNDTTTVYIENWRSLEYYSVGSYRSGNFLDLTIDSFRGRLSGYAEATRTVTNSSDAVVVTNL